MSCNTKRCFLIPTLNTMRQAIHLPDGEEVTIGRSPGSTNSEMSCSRDQVAFKANYSNASVSVKSIGKSPSYFNGNTMSINETYHLENGSVVEIVQGTVFYKVEFQHLEQTIDQINTKKSSSQSSSQSSPPSSLQSSSHSSPPSSSQSSPPSSLQSCQPSSSQSSPPSSSQSCPPSSSQPSPPSSSQSSSQSPSPSSSQSSSQSSSPSSSQFSSQYSSQSPSPKKSMTYAWISTATGELLMCVSSGFEESKNKIASFDLDGTIIKRRTGRVFGNSFDNWMLWDDSIKSILAKLVKDDYKIIIFTNQAGLGTVPVQAKVDGFKRKVERIIEALNVPVQVFVATSIGIYRKPSPGMWLFMKMRMGDTEIDFKKSFYVGDAAGRPLNWKKGKNKDFAASDRMFAINIGIKFYTPEEYFLGEPVINYTGIKFHPSEHDKTIKLVGLDLPTASQEVIVMVGSPGSGKSHFIKNYIIPHGYHIISGTWQKCVALLHDALKSQKSAVVDNSNPDRASRQRFIQVCSEYNVNVRCLYMELSFERCHHNLEFREIVDLEHEVISPTLITIFHSNFERPTIDEGFSSIVKIPFVPLFENDKLSFFYNYYLVGNEAEHTDDIPTR